ncbi:MAG TPA: peptide ABC transporter substrate-binding protein [Candidatus Limnocylindria bacterium]|nr:peptide ABC transporter substrate-binding protein [Candidatus Limnocylindria bacterium]
MRLLIAAVLIVSACAPTATGPPAPAADGPRAGGTVVIAWQEPDTLLPPFSTGAQTSALVSALTIEGLVRVLPDGTFAPALAEAVPTTANGGVTISADGAMTVRYRLRPGLRWSDGAPLTSDDVRFTWELIVRDPKVVSREGYDQISDVDASDPRVAAVRYRGVYPAYLTRFGAVLPRHALGAAADAARSELSRKPIGTGPFRVTQFAAGDHIAAERNPYFRTVGRPYLDRVVVRFVGSVEAAKAQLKAGDVQFAASVSEADVKALEAAGIVTRSAPSPIVESVAFNLARPGGEPTDPHPLFGDVRVRRALILATPKQRIVDALLGGLVRPGRSELSLGWAAPGDVAQEGFDPDAARALLDAAGWRAGPDGIRAKEGARAEVRLVGTTGNRLREQVQQVLLDAWRDVGIAARIQNVPPNVLTAPWSGNGVRQRGDFDLIINQLGLGTTGDIDPQAYLSRRHRCDAIPRAANGGAGSNYERLCDPRIDALLAEAGATVDVGRRRDAYASVVRLLNEHAVAIWLYDRLRVDAFRRELDGHAANPWDQATWDASEWHLRR